MSKEQPLRHANVPLHSGGGKSTEYELAEQDARHAASTARQWPDIPAPPAHPRRSDDELRPDTRPPPSSPPADETDVRRGLEKLARVLDP